ncbi:hypothetical protein Tco_1499400 [Tanacetum coccineum]
MMKRNSIRKKIICLLATYLHQKPKPLSRPQEVEEIKEKEDEVSSDVPINTIVMPIRITFDNPIDFNDHFSKPKDLKKDLTVAFDSTESSILPPPLLDSDSPFTAELSASITLNSLGNEDKVFKPGILVYHAIHDKNLVTLEENLKENISSGTLLVFKEPSFLLPPPEPPDECLNFEPNLVMKNVVLNEDLYQSKKTLPLNVEDVNSFTFIIWTFLPYFTYTEESPLIFSFRSENFVFDPGIVTFHKPGSSRACDSVTKNKPLRGRAQLPQMNSERRTIWRKHALYYNLKREIGVQAMVYDSFIESHFRERDHVHILTLKYYRVLQNFRRETASEEERLMEDTNLDYRATTSYLAFKRWSQCPVKQAQSHNVRKDNAIAA